MSEGDSLISGRVVIVGGGVAGLEALIALRDPRWRSRRRTVSVTTLEVR
jgi:NADPH-dependent 2,4-dienoyl-CoA reductase/sulfur reductase-like enzyme